jgi:hypothetical protein
VLVIAALAVILVPISVPFREARMMQARMVWAADLARAVLKKNRCEPGRLSLSVALWPQAASVDISGKEAILAGERMLQATQLILPYQESEPVIIMLDEVGQLSKAQSRVMVSRDDLRVIEVITAE